MKVRITQWRCASPPTFSTTTAVVVRAKIVHSLEHRQIIRLSGTAHAARNPPQTLVGDPSPRQTSIGEKSDCVMKSERDALVRGSDPPKGHRVHTKTGDMWRAPARRLRKKYLAAGV